MIAGVRAFAADVRERRYPEPEHGYTMAPDEVERLRALPGRARRASRSRAGRASSAVHTGQLRFSTEGDGDVVDLTAGVQSVVAQSGVETASSSVFVPGSTAAVTPMEYEPGGVHDLRAALERLVPREGDYEHNRLNPTPTPTRTSGRRSSGPSETIPVAGGRLETGTWQQMVLVDFDDRPRERTVTVQVLS